MRGAILIVNGLLAARLTIPALGGNGTILQSFPGGSGPGYKASPDTTGAVGPNQVVDFEDSWFMVHDKVTGRIVMQMTMSNFWMFVQPSNTLVLVTPNDPRMLYDTLSGRWFASCADDATQHRLYLAVSTSSDPTQPWKGVRTPFQSPDFGFRMGVDKNGFYACWWNFNSPNTHILMDGCAIPKADMIAAGGPDLSHTNMFRNFEVESFPATDLNPNKALTDPEVFLNKQFPTDTTTGPITQLCLYKITWSNPTTASMSALQLIPFSRTYWGPNGSSGNNTARQPAPGSPLRTDEGRRTIGVFAYGGRMLGCNGAKNSISTRPGILWYDVRVSDGALLQEGLVDDPNYDYTHPSLAVDASGNIGLGCTRTCTNEYPSVYIMMHAATDPAGTMRAPVKAVPGTTYFRYSRYNPIPWGNYSATCIDPSDPNRLWTYQEYANSTNDGEWSTAWASFQLNPVQAPALRGARWDSPNFLFNATNLVAGLSYAIQTTTNLLTTNWSNQTNFNALQPIMTLTNPLDAEKQRYYRLVH